MTTTLSKLMDIANSHLEKKAAEEPSHLEMMLKEIPEIEKKIEILNTRIKPTVNVLNQKGLPLDVLQQAQKEYKSYRWRKEVLSDRLLGLKQQVEVLQRVPAPVKKEEPVVEEVPVKQELTQLSLLLKKIEVIESQIKQTVKEMAPLAAMLKAKGLRPNIAEAAKGQHDRLEEKLTQLNLLLKREKERARDLAKPEAAAPMEEVVVNKPQVKKYPVNFIMSDTGEVKSTRLVEDQLRNVIRDLKGLPHKQSVRKRPDGSEFIEFTLRDTDDINFPAFLKHIITNAASSNSAINKRGTAMDDKVIIAKLIRIANNQQKIIEKLAQQVADPNIQYLTNQVVTAIANTSGFRPKDMHNAFYIDSSNGRYVVTFNAGAPTDEKLRALFFDNLKRQISAQKPDLIASLDNPKYL